VLIERTSHLAEVVASGARGLVSSFRKIRSQNPPTSLELRRRFKGEVMALLRPKACVRTTPGVTAARSRSGGRCTVQIELGYRR
jgi:hypothetical protein